MKMDEFIDGVNELRQKYEFCIEEDCDLWSMMTGFLFYRTPDSEKPFTHITGIQYNCRGDELEGDFEGALSLLKAAVKEEYNE